MAFSVPTCTPPTTALPLLFSRARHPRGERGAGRHPGAHAARAAGAVRGHHRSGWWNSVGRDWVGRCWVELGRRRSHAQAGGLPLTEGRLTCASAGPPAMGPPWYGWPHRPAPAMPCSAVQQQPPCPVMILPQVRAELKRASDMRASEEATALAQLNARLAVSWGRRGKGLKT